LKPERERREIEGEEGVDMRVPPDSERGRESVGLGWLGWCWAAASLWAPGAAQLGWFLLFFVLIHFYFLFFFFFCRFCIKLSTLVKPMPKFSKTQINNTKQ
jgi:hypothetical protein